MTPLHTHGPFCGEIRPAITNGPDCPAGQEQIEAPGTALSDHAADAPAMEVSGCSASPSSHHASPSSQHGDNNIELIAQAVAALLSPMIAASVEKTVHVGMKHIKQQLGEHTTRLNKAESCLSSVEEELYQAQAMEQAQDKQPICPQKIG